MSVVGYRRAPVFSAVLLGTAAIIAVPAGAAASTTDVYVGTPRVLADDAGAPTLSRTGRYVAYSANTPGNPGQLRLVRRDRSTGQTEILTRTVGGRIATGHFSQPPSISWDGDRVAFTSDARYLVAGDDQTRFDAFVRRVSLDRTILASRAASGGLSQGNVGSASLSRNGRYVAFVSDGTDLVPGSTTTNPDVYRRDLWTGTTIQITVRPDGTPSRGPGASSVDISANGNLVAFTSYNTDMTRVDGNDLEPDLFVRNVTAGTTRWLSRGFPAGAEPFAVVLSPDGRWVSTRWADGSLHLTEVATGSTRQVASDGFAQSGAFSADGRQFVYTSAGSALLENLVTGQITDLRTPAGGSAAGASISGDGRFAAYGWNFADGSGSRIYLVALR